MRAVPEGFVGDVLEGLDGRVPLAVHPVESEPPVGEVAPEGSLEPVLDRLGDLLPAHGAILLLGRTAFRGDRRILVAMA